MQDHKLEYEKAGRLVSGLLVFAALSSILFFITLGYSIAAIERLKDQVEYEQFQSYKANIIKGYAEAEAKYWQDKAHRLEQRND